MRATKHHSLMAAGLQMPSGCMDSIPFLSSTSCQPFSSLAWSGPASIHSSRGDHQGSLSYKTSRKVGQDKESLPGPSHWVAPPLICSRGVVSSSGEGATFSLSPAHSQDVIDLLRAAAGDLRTEIVRVAFSISSQGTYIWTRVFHSQVRVHLPPAQSAG